VYAAHRILEIDTWESAKVSGCARLTDKWIDYGRRQK